MKLNSRTTITGILIGICFIGSLIAVILKQATLREAAEFLGFAVSGLTALGFIASADSKKGPGATMLVVAVLLAASCKPTQQVIEKTVTKDTIIYKEKRVPYDTTIYIPGDSILIIDKVPCPDFEKKQFKSGRVTGSVEIKDSVLTVDCKCADLEQKVTLFNNIYEYYKSHASELVRVEQVRYVPGFVKFLAWTGGILLLLLLGIIIYKLIKLFKPL